MADESPSAPPPDPPVGAPIIPVMAPPPIDAGIVSWAMQIRGSIENQPGVEDVSSAGGSVLFRFRGQSFVVNVYRTT